MFGKSSDVAPRTMSPGGDRSGQSILQEGVVVRGDLEAKGDVRLDGRLEGKVRVSDRLTVGSSGHVVAEIEAKDVVVMGKVEGSITATDRIELKKGAHVEGDLQAPVLIVEEGVFFDGHSRMGAASKQTRKPEGEILSIEKKPPVAR
ncbi:MAG: polymer-forming cytoskeletal protein [Candidatus Eisenbacteria bacterium]|uniref:Polymer-forming cytoskeletal protein n=1 Tax=Eiseniibacteriota bacterium TaxID=2212470 RepID=A0A956SEV6_UNCEI|nr:polymer-forming cytoskeletal protein [Candidatus Eisenbacteria bacterium]MCB9465987.1 polymer-forming cytoskeletal protein [Candidatus Eisenbacteria bacterium]